MDREIVNSRPKRTDKEQIAVLADKGWLDLNKRWKHPRLNELVEKVVGSKGARGFQAPPIPTRDSLKNGISKLKRVPRE